MRKILVFFMIYSFTLIATEEKKELKVRIEKSSLRNRIDIYIDGEKEEKIRNIELVEPEENERIIHRVVFGDTLRRLSIKYGTTIEKIAKDNKIKNPNKIYVGDYLSIKKYTERKYIMKEGDTLYRIANRYGVTVDSLKELNNIENVKDIDVGKEIIIRKGE